MALFNVSTGDGNDGVSRTFPDMVIEAKDIIKALERVLRGLDKWHRNHAIEHFSFDSGEGDEASLCWDVGPRGERALNGCAWKIIEIWPAKE